MSDSYITKPRVYVVGRQSVVNEEVARFLEDEGVLFATRPTSASRRSAVRWHGYTCPGKER